MRVAADMMTRPLFMAIMVTSWMCIRGRCDSDNADKYGISVNCLHLPDSKSVTCTVDYSTMQPEKCEVNASYLCDIHCIHCINGTGSEKLSFDVRNGQEGVHIVSYRALCGVAYASVNITLQNPVKTASSNGSDKHQDPTAPSRALWGGAGVAGVAVAVAVFIIFSISKHKRLCSRLLKLPARDTDVESVCSRSNEEPVTLLDTNIDEASS